MSLWSVGGQTWDDPVSIVGGAMDVVVKEWGGYHPPPAAAANRHYGRFDRILDYQWWIP